MSPTWLLNIRLNCQGININLLERELGDFYSTWKVRQVTSNRNVGQGEGSLETQFLSFPSGGRG